MLTTLPWTVPSEFPQVLMMLCRLVAMDLQGASDPVLPHR